MDSPSSDTHWVRNICIIYMATYMYLPMGVNVHAEFKLPAPGPGTRPEVIKRKTKYILNELMKARVEQVEWESCVGKYHKIISIIHLLDIFHSIIYCNKQYFDF